MCISEVGIAAQKVFSFALRDADGVYLAASGGSVPQASTWRAFDQAKIGVHTAKTHACHPGLGSCGGFRDIA
jgi:hypothetical protein